MDVGVLAGGLRRGAGIQQYSLRSVSFVPSGGVICLEKHLLKQERVSGETDSQLCYDNIKQTCITPTPAVNMATYLMW